MKLLFASSEVFPFSKTGGLADVSSALPAALCEQGVDVTVVTPLYAGIRETFPLEETDITFSIPIAASQVAGRVLRGNLGGTVPVYFIDCPTYFDRRELYTTKGADYPDNAERFIFFSRCIVELAVNGGFDILHLNDWQTAMAAVYARALYNWRGKTVLTIHNLGYQGVFWHHDMHLTNLGWEYFTMDRLEFWQHINFLKGGIYFSDAVTTVSPTYAREILSEEDGFGLNGVLQDVKDRLTGIVNGIDYREWSPENDRFITARYSSKTVTPGKKACRKALLDEFSIQSDVRTPVFGMISRLAAQKGWDLIEAAVGALMERNLVLVVLGSGDPRYHEMLDAMKKRHPDKIGLHLGFSERHAHMIEAGADFFLMPSRYEPCGLNQMISMRYGTVPVVRGVGGLEDTVIDIADSRNGTGVKFYDYTKEALVDAVDRARALHADPLGFARIRKRCMGRDVSWAASASAYAALYARLKG